MQKTISGQIPVRRLLNEIIGVSPSIVRLRRALRKIAKSDENVMLTGEAGVGKSFLARKIHQLSYRHGYPFVEIDCASIFSGNGQKTKHQPGVDVHGFLEKARGGTLVFNNIEKMPEDLQLELYIALNESNDFCYKENGVQNRARIISTSVFEQQHIIDNEKILSKLYYRISSIMLQVPALRNRKQDISHLVEFFLGSMGVENDFMNSFKGLSSEIYEAMMTYDWRGNLDELKNSVRALILTQNNGELMPEALPFLQDKDPLRTLLGKSLPEATEIVEKFLLKNALGRFEGNQTRAAHFLKISEASLRYKLKKYGIPNK